MLSKTLFSDPALIGLTLKVEERLIRKSDLLSGDTSSYVISTREETRTLADQPLVVWVTGESQTQLVNAVVVRPLLQSLSEDHYVRTLFYEASTQNVLNALRFATVDLVLARERELEQYCHLPLKLTQRQYNEAVGNGQKRVGKKPDKFYSGWQSAVRLLNGSSELEEIIAGWFFGKSKLDDSDIQILIGGRVKRQRIAQVLAELDERGGAT